MSNIPISSLPAAISLDGSEEVPIVQGGTTKRTTTGAIANTASGFVPSTRTIDTPSTGGLTGGGPLSGDLTLAFAPVNLLPKTAMVVADTFAINNSVPNQPYQVTFPNAMKALTGLSVLSVPSLTNDYLIINHAADGQTYKVNPSALGMAAGNLPAGGTTAQVLAKASNTNYDTVWADPSVTLQPLSLAGNPTGSISLSTSITLGTTLAFSGSALQTQAGTGDVSWSANSFVTAIGNNKVTDAMLRQSSGLSVIGRSASTTGNVADITGTADQVLRVAGAGASLGFGSIDLSKSAAVGSSILGATNGGTGLNTYTTGDTIYASAANTLSALAGNTAASIKYLSQTGTGTASQAPAWATISGGDITGAALTAANDTNVTLTLGGTPATSLLRAASITAGWTGQLGLTRGGTNASLTADNGGIVYSGASALAILASTATARQMLQSGASGAPAWSTATWPATTTINQLLYSSSANTVAGLATANGGILNTSSSGVPSVTATPVLGVAGSTVGSIGFQNASTGTITVAPTTGALGSNTLSLPAATDTFAVLAASQAITNKTYNGLTITPTTGTLTVTNAKTLTASNSITLAGTDGKSLTLTNGLTVTTNDGTLAFGAASKTLTVNNSLALSGTDSTTMTFPSTSSTVLTTGNTATITKGYTVTPNSIGTVSSGTTTIDPTAQNYQYLTNNGAFTLAAPASDSAVDLLVTNGASAGSITFSGFTVGSNTGSALTTTNTNKFIISIRRINSVSTYSIYALQ